MSTPATAAALRALIYTRVSKDKSGRARSPQEQEAQARIDCARHGLDVVEVYTDNDVGASRYSKGIRHDFARLRADIEAGRGDVVVAWEASRLTRDTRVLDDLADVCQQAGAKLLVNGQLRDPDDGDDRFSLSIDGAISAREAWATRKRTMRALAANAEAGRPHGRVQYGYTRRYATDRASTFVEQCEDGETAAIVRELFDRAAAGVSLRTLATDLNARGVATPGGRGVWGGTNVRQLLTNRGYLGHRTHNGAVVVENAWPALVDEATFYKVQAVLADPKRCTNGGDSRVRHLLSGLVSCGVCGGVVSQTTVGHRVSVYRCKFAGHVGRKQQWMDEAVERLVVGVLSRPRELARLASSSGVELQRAEHVLDGLRAELAEWEREADAGRVSPAAFGRQESRLLPKIDAAEQHRDALSRPMPDVVKRVAGAGAQQRWDATDIAGRRQIVRTLLPVLQITPVGKGAGLVKGRALGLAYSWVGSDDVYTL